MRPEDLFPPDAGSSFEESVRVDRPSDDEEKLRLLEEYHITDEVHEFLSEFFVRLEGEEEEMRRGWNHWLYGYFGSGKSHLLAVLGHLIDAAWVNDIGRDTVWEAFASDNVDTEDLEQSWKAILSEYHLQPLFVNLLKHQGRQRRGFNQILLGEAHREEGLSTRLDVAYFERWYQDQPGWQNRDSQAEAILERHGVDVPADGMWSAVQRYEVLSDLVLPRLLEDATGTRDGLDDLVPSTLGPNEVLGELETWRSRLADETGKPTKLVLLLDEISLFIGTDYDQLTILNALAENIDEVGKGDILSVVTAQERIEHVQPEYAGKGADFSILKDRFPHRRQLPSRHVGEIVQSRLLAKRPEAREQLRETVIEEAAVNPADIFHYAQVEQNTDPPLNDLDEDGLLDFYPLLPYHPPLFMEILSNLRDEDADRAKSIFSGTARASLALVDGLLESWIEDGETTRLLNLVDFYEIVEPELEDMIHQRVKTITKIEQEYSRGDLEEVDVDVAKAVLLLQYVHEMIPLDEPRNIAVSIMRDAVGANQTQTTNAVRNALDRLAKYIRPNEGSGAALRFTDREEREILDAAEKHQRTGDWDEYFEPIAKDFWPGILTHLDLPAELPYGDDEDTYPVRYSFVIDGREVPGTFGSEEGLDVPILVDGLLPSADSDERHLDKLYWHPKEEGERPVREAIRRWATLALAVEGHHDLDTINQDLEDRKQEALQLASSLLNEGSYAVKQRETTNREEALAWAVAERYPSHFHPAMLEVGDRDLRDLSRVDRAEDRPAWAEKIQVPIDVSEVLQGEIQTTVAKQTGQQLEQHKELSLTRLLELVIDEEPTFSEARNAIVAILWGLCKTGVFRAVDSGGDSLPAKSLLDRQNWSEVRLREGEKSGGLRDILEENLDFVSTQDSVDQALVKFERFLRSTRQEISTLQDDLDVTQRTLLTTDVSGFLKSLKTELEMRDAEAKTHIGELGSSDTEWNDLIDDALASHDWIEQVRGRWERRRAYLLQLDALVSLQDRTIPGLTRDTDPPIDELVKQLDHAQGIKWWVKEGWNEFTSTLDARDDVLKDLKDAWQTFAETQDRARLADRIQDHDWIAQTMLTPGRVRKRFRRGLLSPLRTFARQFHQVQDIAERLLTDPSDSDAQHIQPATKKIEDPSEYEALHRDPQQIETAYQRLVDLVGDRSPDDVHVIGLWPGDAEGIRSRLEELEDVDLEIRDTDAGVVIE